MVTTYILKAAFFQQEMEKFGVINIYINNLFYGGPQGKG